MTKEEAIRILKSKMDGHTDTSYEWAETVRMAIEAIEQLPKLQNRCHALTHGQICVLCSYECEHKEEVKE